MQAQVDLLAKKIPYTKLQPSPQDPRQQLHASSTVDNAPSQPTSSPAAAHAAVAPLPSAHAPKAMQALPSQPSPASAEALQTKLPSAASNELQTTNPSPVSLCEPKPSVALAPATAKATTKTTLAATVADPAKEAGSATKAPTAAATEHKAKAPLEEEQAKMPDKKPHATAWPVTAPSKAAHAAKAAGGSGSAPPPETEAKKTAPSPKTPSGSEDNLKPGQEHALGTNVRMLFDDGVWHPGTIVKFDGRSQTYSVQFEDGDSQETKIQDQDVEVVQGHAAATACSPPSSASKSSSSSTASKPVNSQTSKAPQPSAGGRGKSAAAGGGEGGDGGAAKQFYVGDAVEAIRCSVARNSVAAGILRVCVCVCVCVCFV